jgi:hypothetical protein
VTSKQVNIIIYILELLCNIGIAKGNLNLDRSEECKKDQPIEEEKYSPFEAQIPKFNHQNYMKNVQGRAYFHFDE